MEKGKVKVGEEISKEVDQQQLEEYLPAYLKKVKDEVDEPKTTIEELEEVSLDEDDPDKKVRTLLIEKEKDELMTFLQENKDVFAWSHKDIPKANPSMTLH